MKKNYLLQKKRLDYKHAKKYSRELNNSGYFSKIICDHNRIKMISRLY